MPSVRVRRGSVRPYTVIEDSPRARTTSLRAPSQISADAEYQRRSATELPEPVTAPAPVARPGRRGTISSMWNRNSSPPPVSPSSPTAARRQYPPGNDEEFRRSLIADHVMRNQQQLRNRPSDPRMLLSPGRPTSPQNRTSIRSYGSDIPPVDIRLSREDMEGQVGSALSLPEDERDDDYDEHHHDDIVDHLDVIDPQVATMTHLSNAANSIILPPLSIYSRRPVMNLPTFAEEQDSGTAYGDELDKHVHHVLTRRQKVRRALRGFWAFVRTPVGFCTALYGFLCAFWGAAIVIFLAKIINLHNSDLQNFWVEVSSQVTNGLFTATGIGLIPWRAIDTYRMAMILHYKHQTRKLRAAQGLPPLVDEDDLPDPMYNPDYVHVLTDKQQKELHYQQQKFMQSQTWYRPHATETHRAFSISTALWICLLIDGNSIFQIFLCGCMWGLDRFTRPAWTTGLLIPASFLCAIAAAIMIFRGSAKTKKTTQVENKLREALQLEKEGMMNAHIEDRDGFAVVEKSANPPPDAETLVIPDAKPHGGSSPSGDDSRPDLVPVPSGPADHALQKVESRKAPVLP